MSIRDRERQPPPRARPYPSTQPRSDRDTKFRTSNHPAPTSGRTPTLRSADKQPAPAARVAGQPKATASKCHNSTCVFAPFVPNELYACDVLARLGVHNVPQTLQRVVCAGLREWHAVTNNYAPTGENHILTETGDDNPVTLLTRAPGDGEVESRVILLARKLTSEAAVQCVEVVPAGGSGSTLYGGCVADGTDEMVLEATQALVAKQTALSFEGSTWGKLCVLEHSCGRRCHYYVANVGRDGVREDVDVRPLVRVDSETCAEREGMAAREIVRDADSPFEEAAPSGQSLSAADMTARMAETVLLQPKLCGLAARCRQMLDANVAVDILENVLRRQAVLDILDFLSKKNTNARKAEELIKADEAAAAAHTEKIAAKRIAADERYKAEVEVHRAEWRVEDEGETQDEIAEKEPEREKVREALRASINAESQAEIDIWEAERKRSAIKSSRAPDRVMLSAFTLLAMSGTEQSDSVQNASIISAIHAAFPEKCRWECEDMLGGALPATGTSTYKALCTVTSVQWVVPRDDGITPFDFITDARGSDVDMAEV